MTLVFCVSVRPCVSAGSSVSVPAKIPLTLEAYNFVSFGQIFTIFCVVTAWGPKSFFIHSPPIFHTYNIMKNTSKVRTHFAGIVKKMALTLHLFISLSFASFSMKIGRKRDGSA